MADPCAACGREPWAANSRSLYDAEKHCLAHTHAVDGKRDCEARELVRLRAEVARLHGAGNHVVEAGGNEPVHLHFGLSYASYFVWQRSLMQAMPLAWQQRFVQLATEFDDATRHLKDRPDSFMVRARNDQQRFISDPYGAYRHSNLNLDVEGGGHG